MQCSISESYLFHSQPWVTFFTRRARGWPSLELGPRSLVQQYIAVTYLFVIWVLRSQKSKYQYRDHLVGPRSLVQLQHVEKPEWKPHLIILSLLHTSKTPPYQMLAQSLGLVS